MNKHIYQQFVLIYASKGFIALVCIPYLKVEFLMVNANYKHVLQTNFN